MGSQVDGETLEEVQLIMPFVYNLIVKIGAKSFTAWRIAFFIPALFQTVSAFAVMIFGQDMPDGNYQQLHKSGEKHKDNFTKVIEHGVANYRGWITALCCGYCFGVELTVDNINAQYFYDRFDMNLHSTGVIAASFGQAWWMIHGSDLTHIQQQQQSKHFQSQPIQH